MTTAPTTPAVVLGYTLSRNQSGRYREVLSDPRVAASPDPLVRFELARAMFLASEDAKALETLRSIVADPAVGALFAYYSYPALSTPARILIARTQAPHRGRAILEEWDKLAWGSGLTTAERLRVHFQRTVRADSMYFSLSRAQGDASDADPWAGASTDPRREVYIRFGEPGRVVHTPIVGRGGVSSDYVTWLYADPSSKQPMLFHFAGANSRYGLSLDPGCNENWLAERAVLTPRLGQLFQACVSRSPLLREVATAFRVETRTAYSNNLEREFVTPESAGLRFQYQLFTFPESTTGFSTVALVAAIPASEAVPDTALRAVLALRNGEGAVQSSHLDWQLSAIADQMLVLVLDSVPSDDYSYRVRVSDSRFLVGQVYGGPYSTRPTARGTLTMSDLIIAQAGQQGLLRRGDHSMQPIVGGVSAAQFDVYYEILGVLEDETLEVELAVLRTGGVIRRQRELQLRFTETTGGAMKRLSIRRTITHDLGPGSYELRVSVSGKTSGRVQRSTTLHIQ